MGDRRARLGGGLDRPAAVRGALRAHSVGVVGSGPARARRRPAARARRPRGDGLRARRPRRRAAALRHPRLQAREGADRPPRRAARAPRASSSRCGVDVGARRAARRAARPARRGRARHRRAAAPAARRCRAPSWRGVHLAMEYLVQQNRRVAGPARDAGPSSARAACASRSSAAATRAPTASATCCARAARRWSRSRTARRRRASGTRRRPGPSGRSCCAPTPRTRRAASASGSSRPIALEGDAGRVQRLRARRVEFPGFAETGVRRPSSSPTARSRSTSTSCSSRSASPASRPPTRSTRSSASSSARATRCRSTRAFATAADGVFAAGDCVRGADLIVQAIADGREAARNVDLALQGATRSAEPRRRLA